MKKNSLEYRKEYQKQNLFYFCDVGNDYGSFRYGIFGVPLELISIMKWFRTRSEAESFFYECLTKYKHLLSEKQYAEIFLGKETLMNKEGCSGIVCIETGEAFESCDIAAFIKKDNGILTLHHKEKLYWLGYHWIFVYPEMSEDILENVSKKYIVKMKNLVKYIRAGFSIFDSINMSKRQEARNSYKCKVYCKELDRTFKSIKEAEHFFRKNGLSHALRKKETWYGLHFKKVLKN